MSCKSKQLGGSVASSAVTSISSIDWDGMNKQFGGSEMKAKIQRYNKNVQSGIQTSKLSKMFEKKMTMKGGDYKIQHQCGGSGLDYSVINKGHLPYASSTQNNSLVDNRYSNLTNPGNSSIAMTKMMEFGNLSSSAKPIFSYTGGSANAICARCRQELAKTMSTASSKRR